MIITILDIQEVFQKLINEEITREEAYRWAADIYLDDNITNISYTYFPSTHKQLILEGIYYLFVAIDATHDGINNYFNSLEHIKEEFNKKWNIKITPELYQEIYNQYLAPEIIEENWVFCPKCNEAFKIDNINRISTCPIKTCSIKLNNPFYNKL